MPEPPRPDVGSSDASSSSRVQTNGLAVASLVLGIVGAILALIPLGAPIGLMFGVLAVIFGFLGRTRSRSAGAPYGRAATAGLSLGVLAVAVAIVIIILVQLGAAD